MFGVLNTNMLKKKCRSIEMGYKQAIKTAKKLIKQERKLQLNQDEANLKEKWGELRSDENGV